MPPSWASSRGQVWSSHADNDPIQRVPALFVESNRDAFRMSLQANIPGDVSISSTSPCVWPEGTPPPG